jgi:GTP-binding protein HflX
VELAQLNYLLPRLTGKGVMLSRLGGGIGTRGPGETKLEIDRRRIKMRINKLKQEIKGLVKRRELERKNRKKSMIPQIAVVGYTNAGKSTLVNALAGSDIFVEDKLFATLDPTTRSIELPRHRRALITDTVGFIRDLPPHLVAAFRATLEEIVESDLIIHLLDVSHSEVREMETITRGFLVELGAGTKKILLVLNKIDRLGEEERKAWFREYNEAVAISALTGEGLEELRFRLGNLVSDEREKVKVAISQSEVQLIWEIRKNGEILTEHYERDAVILEARVSKQLAQRLKPYYLSS